MSYLCLFAHSGVQHIVCCVFLRIVYPVLPVSLDCPFLIAPSVFSNVYLQFLWIVHFWLPLRYSLTFICQFLWIVHFWLPFRYSLTFICQFLWIVHFWLPLRYSLTFIYTHSWPITFLEKGLLLSTCLIALTRVRLWYNKLQMYRFSTQCCKFHRAFH